MKASDLFVKCLEAEGVERIYGVPGEENADIMLSLLDSSIEFILCRHEQAAAFAADVYGRLTGKPGLCLGTLGPGATNLVTRSGRRQHGPGTACVSIGASVDDPASQGEPPEYGLDRDVRTHQQMGIDDHPRTEYP